MAQRLRGEMLNLEDRDAALVIAGETNEGKSSLVNALLGRPGLSPVGADVTTGVRIAFRGAQGEGARALSVEATERSVSLDEVSELGRVGSAAEDVQFLEVSLDHPLLRPGLTIVDTPGVGGLDSGHGAITLAALASADALLFVTDASAPLARPELEFLKQASERIGTIVFVLAKRDLYAGWETILRADRELLAKHAPDHQEAPFLAVSSRAELESVRARESGDAEFAAELAAQSGIAGLRTVLNETVLGGVHLLRTRNALQLCRSAVAELHLAAETSQAAESEEGAAELEAALQAATARKDAFARDKRVGTVALSDEFTLLGQELNRELNRELTQLRSAYEEMVRANRLKADDVAESLDVDIRAGLSRLDELLQARLGEITERLGRELELGMPVQFDHLDEPPDLKSTPESAAEHADGLAKVTGFLPAIFGVAALPGLVGSVGALVPAIAPIAPVAAVVGLAFIPLNIVQRRRTRHQQDSQRVIREAIERARIEVPPLLTRALLTVRRSIESDLNAGIGRREQELVAAVEKQRRLARASTEAREAHGKRPKNGCSLSTNCAVRLTRWIAKP